jgi:hypothetical protein
VNAANAFYYRRLELDARTFAKSRRVIERVLRGGSFLTRTELATALARAGLPAEGVRLAYLVMEAELAALVCSGPRRGKQMTYALLEERVPAARALTRDEALATLTQRYFTSHGPATLRDYVWWSGLTAQEARAGLEMTRTSWAEETRDGRTTWCAPSQAATRLPSPLVHLLPTYDEFLIAYKDREGLRDPRQPARRLAFDEYAHHLVIDGRLRGTWKRTLGARRVELSVRPLRTLSRDEQRALALAAARYGQFVGKPVTVTVG